MRNLLKAGVIAFAFSLMFIGATSANAQYRQRNREARREYRSDVRDARQDYRRRVNNGDYQKAHREYREDIRDARKDYRDSTGRRINRGYYVSGARRAYPQVRTRIVYRNGRRYVVRY